MLRWFCAVCLIFFQVIVEVLPVKAQPRCSFQHYTTAEGLSDNRVTCIMKDRDGFMWMGTWAGINRFDGQDFITYKSHPGDGSELKNNRIDNIVEDGDGYLWLQAYDSKVYRFDKQTEQFLSISELLEATTKKPIEVNRITVIHNRQIAVITKGQGIFLISSDASGKPVWKWFSSTSAEYRLASNDVRYFYQDRSQKIWIGSVDWLACFHINSKGIYERVHIPIELSDVQVTSIAENEHFLCFGTGSGKLFRLEKANSGLASIDLKKVRINDLKFSRNNSKLFCSTSKGTLFSIDVKSFQSTLIAAIDHKELLSIYEDRRGFLWIEPHDVGVIMVDPVKRSIQYFTQRNFSNSNLDPEEYTVFEDRRGVVFVKMKGCGFGYFDTTKQRINYFYNDPSRTDYKFPNMVRAEYYDPNDVLWLSTDERGLEKITFPQNEFIYERLVDNTHLRAKNEVRGILGDTKGRLWVASKAGHVYVQKDGPLTEIFRLNNPDNSNGIYVMMEDRKKNIWLGIKGNGLFKAEPVGVESLQYKLTHFVHDPKDMYSISNDMVYSLLEDREGRIWVGTYGGGVNVIDESGGVVRFYHAKNRLQKYPSDACNRVRCLDSDSKGRIWIGTTEGLLILDPTKEDFYDSEFVRYVKIPLNEESLGDNDVQYIYRDRDSAMWVLTSGGLNKAIGEKDVKSFKFLNYSKRDGLPSDYLLSCVEDSEGYLWIATQNGLSRFDRTKELFQNYNVSDGLPALGFSEASSTMAPNGELVFGMLNGYIHFNPKKIALPKIVGNIVFTNLQVNNEDVVPKPNGSLLRYTINHTKELVLGYDQNVVSIDYRLLNYRSPEKTMYAYRLVGLNSTWHNNKNETRTSFTNLSPGTYTFEVKSTNADPNVPLRALTITILSPPWKTGWAYTIYLLLGLLVLWIIRKNALAMLRLRQRIIIERKLSDLKLNFFTNVSHELRTPLTLILNPLEEISHSENLSDQGKRHLTIVRKNAQRMSRFINQLLDLRKAESGKTALTVSKVELVSFVRRIRGYFADLADQKKITINIDAQATAFFAWIDAEKIDIVIYNVLANALKFTPEGKNIYIILRDSPHGTIIIEVVDEGKGVADNQLDEIFGLYFGGQPGEGANFKGTGIGLALSKELIQLHHGKISASHNKPQGLIITIELKPGKDHFEKDNVFFGEAFNLLESDSTEFILINTDEDAETEVKLLPASDQLPLLLLVEDNRDLRSFLRDQLSRIYRVEIAENGAEGLKMATQLLPDVVLSDIMMPEMDGITMLDKLKNDPITSHIPVVLLSAKFSVESQIEGLKYGADHYLAKPFRNDFLVASLNSLIDQRKRLFNSILHSKKTVDVKPTEIVITPHDELFLKKVICIIEEKIKEPQFNIDVVADSMNMSRSPFYKKLKSLSGLSPVEFVKEIRLKRSLQYLDAGETNISQIAFEVGFKSAKYFSTCFKQRFNETPTEYLRSKEHAES